MNKRAGTFLPKDLQVAINTFIEQFNIMEEYNLESTPTEYTVNLLETMSKYPEHNSVLLDLIDILHDGRE